jgi:hypothetical protein
MIFFEKTSFCLLEDYEGRRFMLMILLVVSRIRIRRKLI